METYYTLCSSIQRDYQQADTRTDVAVLIVTLDVHAHITRNENALCEAAPKLIYAQMNIDASCFQVPRHRSTLYDR